MAAVTFKCPHCARVLRTANAPPAGKKVKCPSCGEPFVPEVETNGVSTAIQKKTSVKAVPPPADEDDRPKVKKGPPPAPQAKPSRRKDEEDEDEDRPRKSKRDEDEEDEDRPRKSKRDEDEDEEEDRPRRKKKKTGRRERSNKGLIIGLAGGGGVLLLLILLLILFLLRPGASKEAVAARPAVNPMAYLPPKYVQIFGLNSAELAKRNKLEDLLSLTDMAGGMVQVDPGEIAEIKQLIRDAERFIQATGPSKDLPAEFQPKAGQPPKVPGPADLAKLLPDSVTIVRARGTLDQERVKKSVGAEPVRDVAGVKVFKARPSSLKPNVPRWLAFPDERLAVFGDQPEKEFDDLLTAAKQAPPHPAADLIGQVESAAVWSVTMFDDKTKKTMQEQLPKMAQQMAPKLAALVPTITQSRAVLLKADWVDPGALKVNLGLCCANDADAGKIKQAVQEYWNGEGKAMLEGMAAAANFGAKKGGPAPKGPDPTKIVADVTQSFNVDQQGPTAWASLQISGANLPQMSNNPAGPGGGLNPQPMPGGPNPGGALGPRRPPGPPINMPKK